MELNKLLISTIWVIATCSIGWTKNKPEQESVSTKIVNAVRVEEGGIHLDGQLSELAWGKADWGTEFIQRDPVDGVAPAYQTKFKVLYDDNAIYFGFYLFDDPASLRPILGRRDSFPGDWIEVNISSYFDGRTAFSFTLSLSGTRGDEFVSLNGNHWDSGWDPVWEGATASQGDGWTAEMRIPLSQLRFSKKENQVWGLQVNRRDFSQEERSTWQPIPKTGTGWVSRFGEIHGLTNLKPKPHLELLPYSVSGYTRRPFEVGDPYNNGSDSLFEGGLDGKWGLSKNLTLDFTINPDFGQVEADPSQVNLTSFETFFSEKRPFFIEGNNIFDLSISPAVTGGDFSRDNLFYSRRIGKAPSYTPDADFVDGPERTRILGAFKLSGKTGSGLSIGVLESMTGKETAGFQRDGQSGRVDVEPQTNYFVGRVQQDFRQGETQIGAIVTAVNRDIGEDNLQFLVREAYAGGVDFSTYFKNRDYRLEMNLMGSHLTGSKEAIYELQTSSARYYQRPDNESETLDENRESLDGTAGCIRFSRTSNHDLRFESGVTWRTPGFEINDLGYMRQADQINQFTWVGYQINEPFGIFNSLYINGNEWLNWDTSGQFLGSAVNLNTNMNLKNRWSLGAGLTRNNESRSNTMLRGGPAFKWPGNWNWNVWVNTDSRKEVYGGFGGNFVQADEGSGDYLNLWLSVSWRPTDSLRFSFNPDWTRNRDALQYVSTENWEGMNRYLFGHLDQETLSLTCRLDYSLTPDLTIQFYGSPFMSNGRFSDYKSIIDPLASNYEDRFALFQDSQITLADGGAFQVDEDQDGVVDYLFDQPDFDFREFQSNLVVRWEYKAGSTLYFVWSQNRMETTLDLQNPGTGRDLNTLFSTHPTNVWLVKFSYLFMP